MLDLGRDDTVLIGGAGGAPIDLRDAPSRRSIRPEGDLLGLRRRYRQGMDNPSLRDIDLPRIQRSSVDFWIGKDRYSITADESDAWSVFEFRTAARRFDRIGEFVERDGRYYEFTDVDGLSARPQDWRKIVNSFI